MLGDVNISAILDSFSASYDKRVRPNYGGKLNCSSPNVHISNFLERKMLPTVTMPSPTVHFTSTGILKLNVTAR